MSTKRTDDGGPAFPVETCINEETGEYGHQASPITWQMPGMTLRDYFAGQALPTALASALEIAKHSKARERLTAADVAAWAYELADAMIAESKKP